MKKSKKIEINPTELEIAAKARELWEKGGRQPRRDLDYWIEAEKFLKNTLNPPQQGPQPKHAESLKPLAA